MLGAAALGDIGQHFPDTDPTWSGADSVAMLGRVAAMVHDAGWRPGNADCTVVLETPASGQGAKLPFTETSQKRVIQTNNVDVDDRGYIYIVDRANTGMHILELSQR